MYPYSYEPYRQIKDSDENKKVFCSEVGHKAVDTGTARSWCKHCDVTMWFNRETAEYETTDPYERKR